MKLLSKTLFISTIFSSVTLFAQKSNSVTLHTIKSGETLSALAVKYGTSVGDIMRLNGMNAKSQLSIGETIKVPSSKSVTASKNTTVSNKVDEPKNDVLAGKTHTVQQGETLYKLSRQYNVTVAQLQQWNNMTDLNVKIGQVLSLSPVSNSNTNASVAKPIATEATKPVATTNNPSPTIAANTPTTKPVESEAAKPTESVKETPTNTNSNEAEVINASSKYAQTEGFFANYFDYKSKNKNTLTGDASILKTVSGWTDKKYYVLMNDIAQGTIVRISANNKSICAKVLGSLPDIKEDAGLLLRLSNAAVAELGIEDQKFTVVVNY